MLDFYPSIKLKSKSSYSLNKKKPKFHKLRHFKIIFGAVSLFIIGGGVLFGVLFGIELRKAADKIPKLPQIMAQLGAQPTRIMSADGKILALLTTEYRQPIRIEDVPKKVIDATLAAEDRRFYQHSGVDYIAMLRAVFVAARGGHLSQGGSTLTMQIAKRIYSQSEHSLKRKLQDIALAVMIERHLTKDQVMELYLNQVYYGSGAYGIKAAADVYFGKDLKQLTVAEAALLARLVKRPSGENPFVNLEKAIQNRNFVLKTMLEEGMINEAEYDKAIQEKPHLSKRSRDASIVGIRHAPYFVDYVLKEIKSEFPDADLSSGGYRIDTTLNLKMQEIVEHEVEQMIQKNRSRGVQTVAFTIMNREGQILAMIGGADYQRNQYNMITQGKRQPGSAFKTFIYAIGLETGALKPNESLSNEPYVWKDPVTGKVWAPRNASRTYGGSYSIKSALAASLNLPVIRAAEKTGASNVAAFSRSLFGFESPLDPVLALALGCSAVHPIEMAQGYSVFMLGGDRAVPYGLSRVLSSDGSVMKEYYPEIKKGVLSSRVALLMDEYLRTAVTNGSGKRANIAYNARGKTGTTSNHWDVWFCGYTDELLGVGWAANEVAGSGRGPRWIYKPMPGAYGGGILAPLWGRIMQKAQIVAGEKDRMSTTKESFPKLSKEISKEPVQAFPENDGAHGSTETTPSESLPKNSRKTEKSKNKEDSLSQEMTQKTMFGQSDIEGQDSTSAEQISVEICSKSNLKAGVSCPGVIIRRFNKGEEPKNSCKIH